MTSRRAFLASLGTVGAAGLAGCSAIPFGSDQDDGTDEVELPPDAIEPITMPPSPHPVDIPTSFVETHRERARELLAAVPTGPSVPNGAVAAELRSDREDATDRLEAAVDEPWPIERLSAWRGRRSRAATVRGAYRAATGKDDADVVENRRQDVRDDLAAITADHEYRAPSSIEAVLAHVSLEALLSDCRHQVQPQPAYPSDPIARPFRAGEAVGQVERARATVEDAGRLRATYLDARTDASPQWSSLIAASDRLRFAVARSYSPVRSFLEADEPPFEADLEDTAARTLFVWATREVESLNERHDDSRDDGRFATAVIEAGRTLAAIEALRTTIEGIRDGAYLDSVTADSVIRTAERARTAIAAIEECTDRRLATRIARPALGTFAYVRRQTEELYGDGQRFQGQFAWIELYARSVPAATAFVADRLASFDPVASDHQR